MPRRQIWLVVRRSLADGELKIHLSLVILALAFLVRVQNRLKKRSRLNAAAGTVLGRTRYPTARVRCAVVL
jgi:hypothetical protein